MVLSLPQWCMNNTTLDVVKALSPTLAARSAESLGRTCRAYMGELRKFKNSDEFEKDHLMKSGMGAFSEEIKKKFGTVWTDQRVVDLTVDEALKHFKGDLNTATFCDPACYSDDTEVLTNNGWKLFVNLLDDDLIYSFNPITRVGEYVGFVARQARKHIGEMHYYAGKRLDLLVTPDHSMYTESRLTGRHNNQFMSSSELMANNQKGNTCALVAAAPADGLNKGVVGWTVEHYRLFGLWLGDGYIFKNNSGQMNAFGFGVKKKRKINQITGCLTILGFDYTTGVGQDGKTWFRVTDAAFLSYIAVLDGTHNKRIPADTMWAPKPMLEALVDGLIGSDGHRTKTGLVPSGLSHAITVKNSTLRYYSANKQLADDVQRVLIHLGKITHHNVRQRSRWSIAHIAHEITVGVGLRKSLPGRSVSSVQYNGMVYCVTLAKNHIMLVRRNGHSVFCGNCGDGNFLVTFYRKLVAVSTIQDPVERSLDALRRIYGVDIIDRMAGAARIRLALVEHVNYLKSIMDFANDPRVRDSVSAAAAIVGHNIIHGNTLRTEGDTWELEKMEGGMTPEWFRAMKFNVICGNPPYTQYKNKVLSAHLPVPVQYIQKNMALSFWQWASEHTIETYALNTTQSVLNAAVVGKKSIRYKAGKDLVSIIYNDITKNYSTGLGGSVPTIVMTARKGHSGDLLFNGDLVNTVAKKLIAGGPFVNYLANEASNTIKSVPISNFVTINRAVNGSGDNNHPKWNDLFVDIHGSNSPMISFIYILKQRAGEHTQFKWINNNSTISNSLVGQSGTSPIFSVTADEIKLKILWCYLNSSYCSKNVLPTAAAAIKQDHGRTYAKIRLNRSSIALLQVPDLDYYKTTKPVEYQAVLDFAETHIKSNDVKSYCVGVDEVVNNLLGV